MKLVKNIFWHLILLVSLMAISCNGAKYGEPVKATAYLLSSFKNFWNYWNGYVKLSRDFTAFDESEKTISKDIFLKKSKDYGTSWRVSPLPGSSSPEAGRRRMSSAPSTANTV